MYQYVNAWVKSRSAGGRYQTAELATTPVKDLLNQYLEAYLVLSNPALPGYVTLRISDVRNQVSQLLDSLTVTDWLNSLGDNSLPTTDGVPHLVTSRLKFNDAGLAGYKASAVIPGGSPLNDGPDSERDDIWLRRDNTDYVTFQQVGMATVNGFIHRLDADSQGLYIKDGGKTFRHSQQAHIGLLSFRELGTVKTYSITEDMIYHPDGINKLNKAAYINLPESIDGKIVGLVLGGYLHLLEDNFRIVGDNRIKVITRTLPLMERFFQGRQVMDFSALEQFYLYNTQNPDYVNTMGFYGDAMIKAWMTLSQSFVFTIDCDNLYRELHKLEFTRLPGRYYHYSAPQWPLLTEWGRLPSYMAIAETEKWVIALRDNFYTHYRARELDHTTQPMFGTHRRSAKPVRYAPGYLLEVGTDRLVIN